MITSLQLINEYCNRFNLPEPKMIRGDLYTCNDVYLLLKNSKNIEDFSAIVGKDFSYASKVNRIVTIVLKCDVGLGDKLLKKDEELSIIHLQKENPLNEFRAKSVNQFLIFFKNSFNEDFGTRILDKITLSSIIKRSAETGKKIYYKELAKQLYSILEELKSHNISCKLTVSELSYRNNKYIFTWMK